MTEIDPEGDTESMHSSDNEANLDDDIPAQTSHANVTSQDVETQVRREYHCPIELTDEIINRIYSWCYRNTDEPSATTRTKMSGSEDNENLEEAEKRLENATKNMRGIQRRTLQLLQQMERDVESATRRAEEIHARTREKREEMRKKENRDSSQNSALSQATTLTGTNHEKAREEMEDANEPIPEPSGVRKSPKKKKKSDKDKKRKHGKDTKERKKKRYEETSKEKLDRKAFFAMKDSPLYKERDAGGKFKPFSQSKTTINNKPAATSTPVLVLKRYNGKPRKIIKRR